MQARFAEQRDTPEVIRLAALMYASMGLDGEDPRWLSQAEAQFRSRLGTDVQGVVVDDPDSERLLASGAAVIALRLPTPNNPGGRVGYIQWVATDEDARRMGLGASVMRLLIDWCAEQGAAIVELHATPDGEGLYRSLGFGQDGGLALRRRTGE
jgi:GNAT superfamily N-acetyltransferase